MCFRFCLVLSFVLVLVAALPVANAQNEGLVMVPDTVDFGEIPVGGNYFGKLVYFANNTGESIVVNSPYIGGQDGNPFAWFSNIIGQFNAGDGFDLTYGVRFRPPSEGPFETDLCIPVMDFSNPCVHLRGRGIEPLVGTVFQGQTAVLSASIPNPGFRALDLRIRTGQPWATPLPSFAVVPAGDALEVTIALNATELESGTYRDTLVVEAVGVYYDFVLPYELVVGSPVAEEEEGRPMGFEVGGPFPNPARGDVTIPIILESPSVATVEVFDIRGRRAYSMGERRYGAGRHALIVPGTEFTAGSYVVRVLVQPEEGVGATVIRRVSFVR